LLFPDDRVIVLPSGSYSSISSSFISSCSIYFSCFGSPFKIINDDTIKFEKVISDLLSFKDISLPICIEVGSGSGDWIINQISNLDNVLNEKCFSENKFCINCKDSNTNISICNWIGVEVRYDRFLFTN
jgi:hypothetical protein